VIIFQISNLIIIIVLCLFMEKFFKKAQEESIKTLYKCNALKFNLNGGFQLKGGIISPLYCETGVLENSLETRGTVGSALNFWLGIYFPKTKIDAIIGIASGGISWATSIANCRALPLIRAHGKPKNHGLCGQLDGELPCDGANVIVIDDMITSGNSVLNVVKALREGKNGKKANVLAVCSIFDWDFPTVNKKFEEAGIKKCHITSLAEVLQYGFDHKLFPEGAEEKIQRFCNEQNSL